MRGLLVGAAAVLAVLVPAAPAVPATAELAERPPVAAAAPRVPIPDPNPWQRHQGCTVPVGATLPGCPPGREARPPVACVLPVAGLPPRGGQLVLPDCPRPDPSPEGRVVPVPGPR